MWENELKQLKKYNNKSSQDLESEDRELIKQIIKYLSVARISSFESEILRKELIGMSLEARMRNEDLKSAIGTDKKSFCEDIINNTIHTSWKERILVYMKKITLVTFLIVAIACLLTDFNPIIRINIGFILIIFLYYGYCSFSEFYLEPKFVLEDGLKYFIPQLVNAIYIILLTISLNYTGTQSSTPIYLNSFYVMTVLLILWGTCEVCYRSYIHKLSLEYNWKDSQN